MAARVLVIEDDPVLASHLNHTLRAQHCQVTVCHNGRQGLALAQRGDVDLLLLDILLPELDGLSLLQQLREHSSVPVILLSALGDEQDRIRGLLQGADDYLPKPFSTEELLVRMAAILRRSGVASGPSADAPTAVIAGLELLPDLDSALYRGDDLQLTLTEFRLLQTLVLHQGEVLSKAWLYQTVLHRGYGRYDRGLDLHVSHLRRKLRLAGVPGQPLRTVWGQGYTLVDPCS